MNRAGRRVRIWSALCAFCMAAALLTTGMTVDAAEKNYKVTLRPGPDASFENMKASLPENAEWKEATGSIVYTVGAGEQFPTGIPYGAQIETIDGLSVMAEWDAALAAAEGRPVEGDMEFVVRCEELIDAVEYTIRYVDEAGVDVATPIIAQTNKGQTITAAAKTVADYALAEGVAGSQEVAITEDGMEITFVYVSTVPGEIVENVINQYVGGGTIDEIRTETIYENAPVVGGGGAAEGGEVNIPEEEVPLAPEGEGGEDAGDTDDDTVEIEDEEVPLASGEADDDTTVDIEDEEVPLASGEEQESGSSVLTVAAGVCAAAAVILAVIWFLRKKKEAPGEQN